MNKVTPLVVVAVRECMCAGQRGGAGGGCPSRLGAGGVPRRPRLCLAPAPRAPAPGTKARARGLFPWVLGVPRLGARAEGRRPRPRRSLGARRPLLPSRSAGGREGGPGFGDVPGLPLPRRGQFPAVGEGRRAPGAGLQCPLCVPQPRGCRGAEPAAPEARPGRGAVSGRRTEPSRVIWAQPAPLPGRGAAAGHGLGPHGARGTGKRSAPVEIAVRKRKEDGSVLQRVLAFWQ